MTSSSTSAMGVITVSPPAPLLMYVVCFVLFLIILISPELTAQLTCFNEDLLNKTVVEVYLILIPDRLSDKLRIDKEAGSKGGTWSPT